MSQSYVQVPPDGSGKKIYTNQHIISGSTYQIQAINLVSGDDPNNIAHIDNRGSTYTRFYEGDPILGAYGDLKVLQENIIGSYEHTVDSYDDLFTIEEISGGTSTFVPNQSSVILSVTNDIDSRCSRTTNRYHYYQPGVSFLILLSVSCGDSGKVNNRRQWGLFCETNGLYFELSGTTLNIVKRSNITGQVIDEKISQNDWNIDKLDGSGVSGINLNVTNSYQYFININYPSNTTSFGIFDSEKGRIICHKISLSGTSPLSTFKHMSLPIRFNNENIGLTGGSSELRTIMAVVKSEGKPDYTFWRYGDIGVSDKNVSTNTPVLSLRPKILLETNKYNRVNSYPETVSIFSSGSTIKVHLVTHNGDILSGSTWNIISDGPLEGDNTSTSIDIDDESYSIMTTFYVGKDDIVNFDLSKYFEINDEGILLNSNNTQYGRYYTFVASAIGGSSSIVNMDFSYRSLF